MVRGLAKATICGNVTRDPEVRTTTSGNSVTSFGMAVNRVFKGANGGNQEETSFFDITAWGKTGETIAQYVKKGTPLLVSGRLHQHSWDDKNGGKRSSVELVLEDFCFLSGGNNNDNGGYSAGNSSTKTGNTAEVVPDDIPMDDGGINAEDLPF